MMVSSETLHFKKKIHLKELEEVGERLGVRCLEDWYRVRPSEVGSRILAPYGRSLIRALKILYPKFPWIEWRFEKVRVPKGFWKNQQNHRDFLLWTAKHLELRSLDDWYDVRPIQLMQVPGLLSFLQHMYRGSILEALRTVHKEHRWQAWRFVHLGSPRGPMRYDPSKHREFLENFLQRQFPEASREKLSPLELWNRIPPESIARDRSMNRFLKSQYGGSLSEALRILYPQQRSSLFWQSPRLRRVPRGFWSERHNVRSFCVWLGEELQVVHSSDWSSLLSHAQLTSMHGSGMLRSIGGLRVLLSLLLPSLAGNRDWCSRDLSLSYLWKHKVAFKQQRFLYHVLLSLFEQDDEEILSNFRLSSIVNLPTVNGLELDYFLPSRLLAFECNGEQHYSWSYKYGDPSEQRKRDRKKMSVRSIFFALSESIKSNSLSLDLWRIWHHFS